jgi:hypothetical protein
MALLLAALPLGAMAQSTPAAPARGEILRGAFTQERHLQGFNAPIRSSGRFVLILGRGLIWQVEQPFAVVTVITPDTLVQYTGTTETLRLPTHRVPALGRLYDMLGSAMAGDWGQLESAFTVTRKADGDAQEIMLTPRGSVDASSPVKAISARAGRFVERVVIERPSGDSDRIAFSGQALSADQPSADETTLLDKASR